MDRRQGLISQRYIDNDREALGHLLKVGVADALARGQTIDLNTNEELPRLIPILCAYFSREELTRLLGERLTAQILAMHQTEVLQNLFLERELQTILQAFNEAHIPLMLFKGPALAYTVYPRPHLRTYHDIDALVHQEDLEKAHDLLTQRGYTFYEEYRANVIDASRSGYNYILKRPDSWLEVLIELHTAPHASEIGSLFDPQVLWEQAEPITVLGEPTLTMKRVDHLLYLCWHYRFHGFTRLLWLYDLVVVLRASTMDWDDLIRSARRQQLATTLYYCLCWCRDLFHVTIPEHVFAQLRPPLVSRALVERLALTDTAKALTVPQWHTRRIIARRAMVDSNRELLKAAMRTLFPSRATLARRYMDNSRLPLQLSFLFYVIHPWITLVKGCRFLLKKRKKQ
jgi:hypothetical protein